MYRGQFELIVNDKNGKIAQTIVGDKIDLHQLEKGFHTMVYSIEGQLVYLNAQAHILRFENDLSNYENIILRFRSLYFIDLDGVDAFDEIIEKQHKKVFITGINPLIEKMLLRSKQYKKILTQGRVFEKTEYVLKNMGYQI